jgi:hypothetical protein
MACFCYPSYSGNKDKRISSSRPAKAKLVRLCPQAIIFKIVVEHFLKTKSRRALLQQA